MKILKLLLFNFLFVVSLFSGIFIGEVEADEIPELPDGVTEEEYLDQKVFREIHGLDTSNKAIFRALDQNYRLATHSDHDIRLTASELKIIQDIDSMTTYMEEVEEIIRTTEDEYSGFASVYIDTRKQGIVHVNIKEDLKDSREVNEMVDEIAQSTPLKEKIKVSYVEFSEQELRDRQKAIVQDDKFSELGITSVYVHYEKNTIGIDVEELNTETEATIKELYGKDIHLEEHSEEVEQGRTDPVDYMEGGLAIGRNTNPVGSCTFSFSVRKLSNRTNNFVTAGHCASLNQNVYQGGERIGTVNY
ncbi:chymotrypsin family serine protease, partial [Alteribacillus iranensis]